MSTPAQPPRIEIAPGLDVSRIVTGLWQVADMEREGPLDLDAAARAMAGYANAGFDTFDMADHYGSAEDIAGRCRRMLAEGRIAGRQPIVLTKWVPTPGPMTAAVVEAGVRRSMDRLQVETIDLLQFHWWTFEHPGYLDAMAELAALRRRGLIRHLGLTNFDTDHLRVLVRNGIPIATNQVCFSLLDRRAGEEMSAFCLEHGIRLVAYGTMAGGFLSEQWLGRPAPGEIGDWSKMKYRRFIDAMGGWDAFQSILAAADTIARKHGVSIANVAGRYILEQPAVAAIIVGARLGESEHRADNLKLFSFELDAEDRALLERAFAGTSRIPGDCGDEYRRPPFLTASGDLSHHLESLPQIYRSTPVEGRAGRWRVDSGSVWEPIAGYSRAVRVRDRILVSGTTSTHGPGEVVCPDDASGQAVYILDKIAASIRALGGTLEDVVRTRIYLKNAEDWEAVSRAHGHYLGHVRPANTLIEVSRLVGDYLVEIEAEAMVDPAP